jgi:biotin carboxyl carrier protein
MLTVVDEMKMQHAIAAGRAGRITNGQAREGELVEAEALPFDIQPARVVLRRKNR